MSKHILASVVSQVDITVPSSDGSGAAWGGLLIHSLAAPWLEALAQPDASFVSILNDLLTKQSREQLYQNLATGSFSIKDVEAASKAAVEAATGRNWWEVLGILAMAEASWDSVGGELVLGGMDPFSISIGAWLDATWLTLRKLALNNSQAQHDHMVSEVTAMPSSEMTEENMVMSFDEYMAGSSTLPPGVAG